MVERRRYRTSSSGPRLRTVIFQKPLAGSLSETAVPRFTPHGVLGHVAKWLLGGGFG